MAQEKDRELARVLAMLNVHLRDETKDFGLITDYIVITEGSSRRYVFVTDTGRKIDANSAMRFRNAYLRRKNGGSAIVYPEGSTTAMRKRAMRVKRSGSASVFGNVISNVASIGDEKINMTTHMSSSNEFDEENDPGYSEKIAKAKEKMNNE